MMMQPPAMQPPQPVVDEGKKARKIPKDEHRLERVVRLAVERFNHRFEALMKSMETSTGRPAFSHPLTDQEKLERWFDPVARADIMLKLQRVGGEGAVMKYVEDMTKLMMKIGGI